MKSNDEVEWLPENDKKIAYQTLRDNSLRFVRPDKGSGIKTRQRGPQIRQRHDPGWLGTWRGDQANSTNLAKMYGLIKTHKESMPMRPILDSIDTPVYRLAK
ncbi:hypothetical protein Ciccas_008390 [Cichlidogyrus casuarinus]|uniref:Uncharacterized protein n=1 Tax=Cichlidogyrus casuarinus TaxID=1844966 RepID=A0ABD2Q038_9PLAT